MIAQVLNRDFVLDQLQLVRAELEKPHAEARRGDDLPFVHDADVYANAAEALRAAEAKENTKSSGQENYDAPADRRGVAPAPIDDVSFFSHDPIISNLQSALDEYFTEQHSDALQSDVPVESGRRGENAETPMAGEMLASAPVLNAPSDNRRIFGAFSETDPRWVASLFAEGVRLFNGRHPFNKQPAPPLAIGDNARLVIVGDWGSGIPRAKNVATQMRKVLDEGKANRIEQHVIHLGDVYYSGWKREYEKRFLNDWPVRADEADAITSWSLNGNHDMYSGGNDYFDYLLKDSRFKRHAQSSYFSITNSHWKILGLDTAYEDSGLADPQVGWVQATMNADDRKTMLLSHHQLFSAYEKGCPDLRKKLAPVLDGNRDIDAWFWGHEHRCVFYKTPDNEKRVRNARLIGHGGVPVYMAHKESDGYVAPAFYEYRKFISQSFGLEHFALFGFVVLDFVGPKINVRYIDENGDTHKTEEIV